MKPDYEPALKNMVEKISRSNTYYGRISPTLVSMLQIEIRENGAGLLAPYWWGVTQRGRGVRKSTVDTELYLKIYKWMQKRNMFTSKTAKGKINEAKGLTWYINKFGNKQFRNQVFRDVYDTARDECIKEVNNSIELRLNKMTQEII